MWKEEDNRLIADLEFKNFEAAIDYMVKAAKVIEQHNHHPEWSNVYNKIHIELTTHDAGNVVTDKDRNLAQALAQLYKLN
jgi:4a-hydroxytetrahydrobiopterin dehydratase